MKFVRSFILSQEIRLKRGFRHFLNDDPANELGPAAVLVAFVEPVILNDRNG
jgi:hypothetical protein